MSLPRALRRPALAVGAAAVFLLGAAVGPQVAAADTEPDPECPCPCPTTDPGTTPGSIIGSAELTTDVQITGTMSSPQVLMTTPPLEFDGGPVVVEFVAQYLNHLPAAGTSLNGIGFELMVDGQRMERMALAGTHGTENAFWPITLRDVLDEAPRIIPAGTHTIGILVYRWSNAQDGYLKYSTGSVSGWGMPIRLTVYDAG